MSTFSQHYSRPPAPRDFDPYEDLPRVSDELASWLAEQYPQRCWDPQSQTEQQHHRYAGMVSLAEFLIKINEAGKAAALPGLTPDAVDAQSQP